MLRCSVSTPREGCGVWSFFLSVIAATQGISLFFSLVHCICFPSAALLYLSILVFVFTLDLFFFFYLSTYTMMMMTTNRRQCTIYSWRYPPSYLLSCLHPAIHTSILTRMIIAGSSSYSSSPSIVQLVVVHTLRRLFFSFVPCSLL